MIRAEVIKKLDGYRGESVTFRQEDYDLWMRLCTAGYEGYDIQKVLLNFCEDKYSYGRRKYRYRLDEAYVRYRGFRSLGLLSKGFFVCFKTSPSWINTKGCFKKSDFCILKIILKNGGFLQWIFT